MSNRSELLDAIYNDNPPIDVEPEMVSPVQSSHVNPYSASSPGSDIQYVPDHVRKITPAGKG